MKNILLVFCLLAAGTGFVRAGGLPMWPARLMIPAGFLLLILQAGSELIKRIGFLRGACPDPTLKKNAPSAEEELAAVIKAHAQQGDAK